MVELQEKAKEIFLEAIEQCSASGWETFVSSRCGGNPQLQAAVGDLLRAHVGDDSLLDESHIDLGATIETPALTIERQIGPYRILQKIGEGGFGVVYMAEQTHPVARKVALKVVKLGMDTKEVVARFEAERQALAMMDHPNIARVLDGGATEQGRPYFVMELVRGVPITEYADKNHLNTHQRLDLFVATCRAVQHAHQKGVIHRDIKPSNVMVTLHDGQPVVKVIDFGVSKALNQKLTEKTLFTAYGQMVGTPQYMSPEQAEMSGLDIDTRSDVYSLGVLLYELLTGTTPLDGLRLREAGYAEMQRIIQSEDAPRPSLRLSTLGERLTVVAEHRNADPQRLRRQIEGELDWIVLKSLEKERSRRYESPSSFAMDVQRYLDQEAVEACPPSAAYRMRKYIRRNFAVLAVAVAILLVLSCGLVGTTVGLVWAQRAEHEATQNLKEAETARDEATTQREQADAQRNAAVAAQQREQQQREIAEAKSYALTVQMGQRQLQSGEHERIDELLAPYWPLPEEAWEGHYINAQRKPRFTLLAGHEASVSSVAFQPHGTLFASAGDDGTVRIWDAGTKKQLYRLPGHASSYDGLCWHPEGRQLAARTDDGLVIWDVVDRQETVVITARLDRGCRIGWSADGNHVAAKSRDEIFVWEVATKSPLAALSGRAFAWHPRERLLAVARKHEVYLVHPDGQQEQLLHQADGDIRHLAWDKQGAQLALDARGVHVWNRAQKRIVQSISDRAVYGLTWSPDGRQLAIPHWSGSLTVWDVATGFAHRNVGRSYYVSSFYSSSWSDNGEHLAIASSDGKVLLWDAAGSGAALVLTAHEGGVRTARWSPKGDCFFSGGDDGTLRIWSSDGTPLRTIQVGEGRWPGIVDARWSPTGERLVTICADGTSKVWDRETGRPLLTLVERNSNGSRPGNPEFVNVDWSPDGKRICVNHAIFDASSGKKLFAMEEFGGPWSPNGAQMACRSNWSKLLAHNGAEGEKVFREKIGAMELDPNWSPDGTLLAMGTERGDIVIRNPKTGELLRQLLGHRSWVDAVSWSREGKRLASGGHDGFIRIWNPQNGQQLLAFRHRNTVHGVDWSPDGTKLLSCGAEGTVKLWDATPSYVEAASPRLISDLDARIDSGNATTEDVLQRARAHAAVGRWAEAGDDFAKAAEMLGDQAPSHFETFTWLAGPYPQDLHRVCPPESSIDPNEPLAVLPLEKSEGVQPTELRWKIAATDLDNGLDLVRQFRHRPRISAYAMSRVYAPAPQDMALTGRANENTKIKLWLNGQVVVEELGDQEQVHMVRLQRGWNTLLAKTSTNVHGHYAYAHLSNDPDLIARALLNASGTDDSLALVDRHLEQEPDHAGLRFARIVILHKLGRTGAAQREFEATLGLIGRGLLARKFHNLAIVHDPESQRPGSSLKEAIRWFDLALKAQPNAHETRRLRIWVHARRGDWNAAVADFRYIDEATQGQFGSNSFKVIPFGAAFWFSSFDFHNLYLGLLNLTGDHERIREIRAERLQCTDALDRVDDRQAGWTVRAIALAKDMSDDDLRRLQTLADHTGYDLTKGMVAVRAGDHEAAIEYLSEAPSLENKYTCLHCYYLAIAHAKVGDHEKAAAAYDAGEVKQKQLPVSATDHGPHWWDWVFAEPIRQEAEALIKR